MKHRTLILLSLLLTLVAGCSDSTTSDALPGAGLVELTGRVVMPLEKASLYVYKPGMDLYGPAFTVSEQTDKNGNFVISLPEGDYTVVVRKRVDGATVGPVLAGDNRSEFIKLQVRPGMSNLSIEAPVKVGDKRRLTAQDDATLTGFSGRITDADGQPVEGVRIQVYDHVQMSERPKYVSEKTGPDGRYKMQLPQGGTYYICARDNFGGPPKLGDLYGRYDQGTIEPSAVVVRQAEILKDVNIQVTKIW